MLLVTSRIPRFILVCDPPPSIEIIFSCLDVGLLPPHFGLCGCWSHPGLYRGFPPGGNRGEIFAPENPPNSPNFNLQPPKIRKFGKYIISTG